MGLVRLSGMNPTKLLPYIGLTIAVIARWIFFPSNDKSLADNDSIE
jgi:hypothetical protein